MGQGGGSGMKGVSVRVGVPGGAKAPKPCCVLSFIPRGDGNPQEIM